MTSIHITWYAWEYLGHPVIHVSIQLPRLSQEPAPDQPYPLSTARVSSSIPKAGGRDGETWTYPSQQMFFNAMLRKVRIVWCI